MLFVLVPGAPAWAHNALAEASPDKKATLKQSPSEVKLRFLQKLDPEYTVIAVSDAAKQKVATSDPKVNGATGVVTFDGPLANGVYTVAYQVVSTDGHTVKGSYEFTVAAPEAEAPAEASAEPSIEPTTAAPTTSAPIVAEKSNNSDDSGTTVIGIIVGIAVVVAAAAGFIFLKRRKA